MLCHRQGEGPRGVVVGMTKMLSLSLLLHCGSGTAWGTLSSCNGGTAHHYPSHIAPFLLCGVVGSPRVWWWCSGGINMAPLLLLSLLWCGGKRNDGKEGVLCFQPWSCDPSCSTNNAEKSPSPHNYFIRNLCSSSK